MHDDKINPTKIARFFVITDCIMQTRYSHAELAQLVLENGASGIQLRDKRPRTTAQWIEDALQVQEVAHASTAQFIINDRVDVARAVGAAGAHVGAHDLKPASARLILGNDAILGGTANSYSQALAMAAEPVDYIGVGPVFGTTSKDNPASALGLATLREIAAVVKKPIIAIGGITADNVEHVIQAGAHGVALISSVVSAPNPALATRQIADALKRALSA